jgi:hypothetical protein
MATKKLSPNAKKLANPHVGIDEVTSGEAKRDPEPDGRGPNDRDGNHAQSRKLRVLPGGQGRRQGRTNAVK